MPISGKQSVENEAVVVKRLHKCDSAAPSGGGKQQTIDKKQLLSTVCKKAAGYTATECVEEYSMIDGQLTLTKKKVSYKEVPPDTAAIKILLDNEQPSVAVSIAELIKKRDELIELFKGELNGTDKNRL